MIRLFSVYLVALLFSSAYGQACITNAECYNDAEACQEELIAMYDAGDYQQAFEWTECAENGVTCTAFAQMCVLNIDEDYECLDVTEACADEVQTCSCESNGGATSPDYEGTTVTSDTEGPDTAAPATTAAPDTEGTDAPDTEGTDAPETEGTDAPDTEGTDAPDTDGTDAPGTSDTEATEGTKPTSRPDVTTRSGPDRKPDGDWHRYCCRWALDGKCDQNPRFMRPLCQKSCGTANCRAENADSCKVKVNASPQTCDGYKPATQAPTRPMPSPYKYRYWLRRIF